MVRLPPSSPSAIALAYAGFTPDLPHRSAEANSNASIGLNIQTVPPGNFSARRNRHLFQEEILIVMSGTGVLHHGQQQVPVGPGDTVCYLAGDPEAHTFENTGGTPLVVWAFGNRFRHEVCEYPDLGVAFVEGLGVEVPLAHAIDSERTEERRRR